jgi:hypothetical protein
MKKHARASRVARNSGRAVFELTSAPWSTRLGGRGIVEPENFVCGTVKDHSEKDFDLLSSGSLRLSTTTAAMTALSYSRDSREFYPMSGPNEDENGTAFTENVGGNELRVRG